MPAASRGLRLAGLARFLPAVNLRRHAACEPLDAGAQAPAKERRGGAPPKFAAAARVHGVMGARKQCSGRHSAAARAPAHLGVAVGAAWVVYSVAGRTPWPSSPRAAPHTLPPPPIILAFRGVRAFSNLTVNGDSNPWPPHIHFDSPKIGYRLAKSCPFLYVISLDICPFYTCPKQDPMNWAMMSQRMGWVWV